MYTFVFLPVNQMHKHRVGLFLWLIFSTLLSGYSSPPEFIQATLDVEAQSSPNKFILDRKQVIEQAAKANPQVDEVRAEILRAEARMGQVYAARFPAIELTTFIATALQAQLTEKNGSQSTRSAYDFSFDQMSATFGARMQAIQPLYTFGKIDLRGEAAEAGHRAAKAQVVMKQADIALEAARLFETHLFALEVQRFLGVVRGIAEKSLEETESALEEGTGEISEQDLLRLKSALAVLEMGEHQAEAGRLQTKEGLRAFLALPSTTEIECSTPYLDPLIDPENSKHKTVEASIAWAKDHRSEFEAVREAVKAYNLLARAEHAGYYPDIFLMGFVSGAYTPGREFLTSRYVFDPLGHFVPAAIVGARWQLQWDGAGQRAKAVDADAYKYMATMRWAALGIPAQVFKAYQDLERAKKDLVSARKTLPLTKQWTVRASADYGLGLADSRSLTDAVEAYVTLSLAEIAARHRLNVALLELAYGTGTLLEDDLGLYPGQDMEKNQEKSGKEK